jgi:small-conductance mechanosensitive channel
MKNWIRKALTTTFFLFVISFASSQERITINELLADTAFKSKLPIPMATISVSSEQTEDIMNEVEQNLGLTPEQLERIDSILNSLDVEYTTFQERINEEFLNTSGAIVQDKAKSEIKLIDDQVNEYREIIQEEIQKKESENQKIDKLIIIWDITYKTERTTELSSSVKENLKSIIRKLNDINKRIDEYLNDLLELELKLNKLHADFEGLIKRIDVAREEASEKWWMPDSDPIWKVYTMKKDTVNVETRLLNIYASQKEEVREYYKAHKGNIRLAIIIIILVQISFYFLRFRVLKDQIEDPKQKDNEVLRLFRRPFFPSLLIGFYLAYLTLPKTPFLLDEIIYLAALIPFTVVLINILLGKNKYIVIYLSFIFALAVFSEISFDVEIFSRIFMLIISFLAIILTIIILRHEWKMMHDLPAMRSVLRVLTKLSLILLIISLIGNIIGNYSLTAVLLYGILSTSFLGISMYLLYLIFTGLFISVLNSTWGTSLRVIKKYQGLIIQKIQRILIFVLGIAFIVGSLRGFFVFDIIYKAIKEFLVDPITLGSFTFSINDIILFIVILIITSWIARFINFILQEQVLFKSRKQKDLSASISSLVKFGIITIGFFVAALASGFPLDKITLLISAFGVGIGFGLQNIFNNLVSGIILVFERPLQVGDTIEVGQLLGVVKTIGIRASNIRTFDGSEVIVPNGLLVSNELINWTLSDSQRRLIIKVGVAYGTDPKEVIKILLNVAKKKEGVLEHPEPYVLFKEFGDSALGFELRCFTESEDWLFILSDLHVNVNDAIKEAGIVIPFPQRDLHIKTMDPGIMKSVKSAPRTR